MRVAWGKARVATTALAVVLLASCASAVRLPDEQRRRVSVVKLNKNIQKRPEMYYLGPDTSIFRADGQVATDSKQPLRDYLEKNKISIDRIVWDEISAAFRESG